MGLRWYEARGEGEGKPRPLYTNAPGKPVDRVERPGKISWNLVNTTHNSISCVFRQQNLRHQNYYESVSEREVEDRNHAIPRRFFAIQLFYFALPYDATLLLCCAAYDILRLSHEMIDWTTQNKRT